MTALILEHATEEAQLALDRIVARFPWMEGFGDFVLQESDGTSQIKLTALERGLNAMSYEARDLLRFKDDPNALSARLVDLYSALRDAALRTSVLDRLDNLDKPGITTFQAFKDRVLGDLLPTFCNDPSRGWGCGGFKEDWKKVAEIDAADFLSALDAGLIEHQGRGLYRAPRSHASEQFFWSGDRSISPRPVSLWAEPIITAAVLARLHFRWGWPKQLLGTQSRKWEFDVIAYRDFDSSHEYVACEVKKSVAELDRLIELMQSFAAEPKAEEALTSSIEINAFRKLKGLEARRAPIFWAVGPNGVNKVFQVSYTDEHVSTFKAAYHEALAYPGPV